MDVSAIIVGIGGPVTVAIIAILADLERRVIRISQFLNDRMGADL